MDELLKELAALSESARKSYAVAKQHGDAELCAELKELGRTVAAAIARVSRQAYGIPERAS